MKTTLKRQGNFIHHFYYDIACQEYWQATMDAQNVLNLAELFGMFDVLDGIALVLAVSVLVNYVKWTIQKKKGNRCRSVFDAPIVFLNDEMILLTGGQV